MNTGRSWVYYTVRFITGILHRLLNKKALSVSHSYGSLWAYRRTCLQDCWF